MEFLVIILKESFRLKFKRAMSLFHSEALLQHVGHRNLAFGHIFISSRIAHRNLAFGHIFISSRIAHNRP